MSRLPLYLQALGHAEQTGVATVSSGTLADAAGVNAAIVRKDLSHLGAFGTRGVGYDVAALTDVIADLLGLTEERPVVIIGAGNLGRALASYGGFSSRGFTVVAVLEIDPRKVGGDLNGVPVRELADLAQIVAEHGPPIAVIATPAEAAQQVAEQLTESGVTAILNFAPAPLAVPDTVSQRSVDLSTELQILSFYEAVRTRALDATPPVG